ncbi:MAG TPA: glycosyltransferase family 9 protein [Longimicrobiaceae bacterium]|nr:glycosyltransferase family 9 protein [Longimicrobiaceae bacterium]
MDTLIGSSPVDGPYPIWENNPYVGDIVNADEIDPQIMVHLRAEQSNICQFGHIIENICLVYNLIPRAVKPSLFLTAREQSQALDLLAGSRRPVVGIHAGGTSSSPPGSLWFLDGWRELISKLDEEVSFFQIAKAGVDQKDLSIPAPDVSLRTSMALIWACDIFVGFDSSPAHIATAFDRPTAVLWDVRQKSLIEDRHYVGFAPASMLRWSYPQNRNLMILGEKDADLVDLCIEFVHKTVASFKHQR